MVKFLIRELNKASIFIYFIYVKAFFETYQLLSAI